MKKKLAIVVGTRPNFIKITQFRKVFEKLNLPIDLEIIHTGQHFDENMAQVFFRQFQLEPDVYLNIESATPGEQVGEMVTALCRHLTATKPHMLLCVGDVNSTLSAAVAANKCNVPLVHLESGLRSFDRSMPEEHNRVVTDKLSDYFTVTEQSGWDNLIAEKVSAGRITFAGNTMIDTLVAYEDKISESDVLKKLQVEPEAYVLATLHRPGNVDTQEGMSKVMKLISILCQRGKVVFPMHPRTRKQCANFGYTEQLNRLYNLVVCDPLSYFDFQKLIANCSLVLTDSGGIQEETTYRKVPCLTLRPNTERPITMVMGTNTLIDFSAAELEKLLAKIDNGTYKRGEIPPFWDGHATERIAIKLAEWLGV